MFAWKWVNIMPDNALALNTVRPSTVKINWFCKKKKRVSDACCSMSAQIFIDFPQTYKTDVRNLPVFKTLVGKAEIIHCIPEHGDGRWVFRLSTASGFLRLRVERVPESEVATTTRLPWPIVHYDICTIILSTTRPLLDLNISQLRHSQQHNA